MATYFTVDLDTLAARCPYLRCLDRSAPGGFVDLVVGGGLVGRSRYA
jgi:hypothetical protein